MNCKQLIVFFWILGFGLTLQAEDGVGEDRLEMKGGAVLLGLIESVEADSLRLRTEYAGVLEVDLFQVERAYPRDGKEWNLPARLVRVESEKPSTVEPKEESPSPEGLIFGTSVPEILLKAERDFSLELGVNFSGKLGNTESSDIRLRGEARWESSFDRINLYGRYAYGSRAGRTSADEIIGGGRYTNFLLDKTGVFYRQEVERDEFEGIRLRSTSAAGLSHQFIDDETLWVETRAGLSYRYEDYTDDGTSDFPGVDIGLDIRWQFLEWARFRGSYTYLPSIRNEDDFIVEQDSSIAMPLDKMDFWKMRFGISSQYNNQPDSGRERLDTRMYAELIAGWE